MALHHVAAGEPVDLRPLGAELAGSKTQALVKSDRFEAVRLVISAGTQIPTHAVAGQITLHCLEGRITIPMAGSEIELPAGHWLYLDRRVPHSVRAIENSSVLLTILFEG